RVVGGFDMTVTEAEKAAELVGKAINPMARIIWGCSVEPECEGKIKVMVVITGVKSSHFLSRDFVGSSELDKVR
ncbi:MAG: cell division protein FtsZ, partial [Euryarchaeota archaeon]|nr:cell division protein FtsZ [Euryarchaeota archaeon]